MEFDLVAQFLQLAHEALLRVVTISLIKVIAPQLFIALILTQHAVDYHQNGIPLGDNTHLLLTGLIAPTDRK